MQFGLLGVVSFGLVVASLSGASPAGAEITATASDSSTAVDPYHGGYELHVPDPLAPHVFREKFHVPICEADEGEYVEYAVGLDVRAGSSTPYGIGVVLTCTPDSSSVFASSWGNGQPFIDDTVNPGDFVAVSIKSYDNDAVLRLRDITRGWSARRTSRSAWPTEETVLFGVVLWYGVPHFDRLPINRARFDGYQLPADAAIRTDLIEHDGTRIVEPTALTSSATGSRFALKSSL